MECEEWLVTIYDFYGPDNLPTVYAFSKLNKHSYYSHVETNVLGKEQRIVPEQMALLFVANLCP